jgi:hypothetical protein
MRLPHDPEITRSARARLYPLGRARRSRAHSTVDRGQARLVFAVIFSGRLTDHARGHDNSAGINRASQMFWALLSIIEVYR